MILAQAAETTAPWWGIPVVAGAFALVGAFGAQFVSWRQHKRQHDLRMENDVKGNCIRFLTMTRDVRRNTNPPTWPEIWEVFYEIQFVAPKHIVDAADTLLRATLARDDREWQDNEEEGRQRAWEYLVARRNLVNNVRQWLGLELLATETPPAGFVPAGSPSPSADP